MPSNESNVILDSDFVGISGYMILSIMTYIIDQDLHHFILSSSGLGVLQARAFWVLFTCLPKSSKTVQNKHLKIKRHPLVFLSRSPYPPSLYRRQPLSVWNGRRPWVSSQGHRRGLPRVPWHRIAGAWWGHWVALPGSAHFLGWPERLVCLDGWRSIVSLLPMDMCTPGHLQIAPSTGD